MRASDTSLTASTPGHVSSTGTVSTPASLLSAQQSRVNQCMGSIVIDSKNSWRRRWNILVAILLLYTATVLPYRLCFVEFAIPEPIPQSLVWEIIEWTIDGLFWLDLLAGFFFSYMDAAEKEVTDWCRIVRRYLRGYFALNLIACLPSQVMAPIVTAIVGAFSDQKIDEENSIHKGVRLVRLQRMSRLARLMRLSRLSKLLVFATENPVWQQVRSIRGVRVINMFFGLLYAVHLVACGWYLTAALHEEYDQTWVARRSSDAEGEVSLLSEGPLLKWAHSMYFVLTVFTTVGFGDMSALTTGEIVYCCFTMLLGSVVQSIILSEVINIITSADQIAQQVQEQRNLVEEFSHHTNLSPKVAERLSRWASYAHSAAHSIDVDRMKEVLTSSAMPRGLMKLLPNALYDGVLMKNKFLTILKGDRLRIPLHLPLLLALTAKTQPYGKKQVVRCGFDSTLNLHLVISGTFVHLARPARAAIFGSRPSAFKTSLALGEANQLATPQANESLGEFAPQAIESLRELPDEDDNDTTETNEEESGPLLAPYQIFSNGNFFGEADIFLSQTGNCAARRSAIRCEADGDCLLVHKRDITSLVQDFPRAAEAWYHVAARRENHRQYLLRNLEMYGSTKDLAAAIIQRHIRVFLAYKKQTSSTSRNRERRLSIERNALENLDQLGMQSCGFHRSYAEHVPHYVEKLQSNFDHLRSEVRSDVDKLYGEVSDVKRCMGGIQNSLNMLLDVMQVKAKMVEQL